MLLNRTVDQAIDYIRANPPKKAFMRELETKFLGRMLDDNEIIKINKSITDTSIIQYEDFRIFIEAAIRLERLKK